MRHAQISAARRVNTELVEMYLAIGRLILDRQTDEGWGAKVIARLAEDLKTEFPGTRGFSGRNLRYCRTAARIYADPIGQQLVAQLPWGHVTVLLDQVADADIRLWYAAKAVEHGWSRNVLITHIATALHSRSNDSPTPALTPTSPVESDLVRGLVKDPYRLDFLSLDAGHTERPLEDAIVTKLTGFLAELGPGFAFVGRQVPLRVGTTDFHLDLLSTTSNSAATSSSHDRSSYDRPSLNCDRRRRSGRAQGSIKGLGRGGRSGEVPLRRLPGRRAAPATGVRPDRCRRAPPRHPDRTPGVT